MKGILLIIDGLGDRPVEALQGKTPLEAARTPVLDGWAAAGAYGLVDPIGSGRIPNTHSGAGLLLGLRPDQSGRLARGPVEAAGRGLDLKPGNVALRANLATLERGPQGMTVIDRRAGRISEGAGELVALLGRVELGGGISATVRPTEQHRCVVILDGPGLSSAISDTDPGDRANPPVLRACRALAEGAAPTAEKVNRLLELAHVRLSEHPLNLRRRAAGLPPANGIITRGAGTVLSLDNYLVDQGLRAGVVSGCNTVRGLGRLFGFDVVEDARFTGSLDTDLTAKVAAAVDQLQRCDVVFVHIKAPDICGHDRQPRAKRDFLEKIDAALTPLAGMPLAIAVAADHTTDSNTGFHTADPVPAILYIPGRVSAAGMVKYGESQCRHGNLPRQGSHEFLRQFVDAIKAGAEN